MLQIAVHDLNLKPVAARLVQNLGHLARHRPERLRRFPPRFADPGGNHGWGQPLLQEPRHKGANLVHHLERRIELSSHPLDGDQRFDEQHQVGWEFQAVPGNPVDGVTPHLSDSEIPQPRVRIRVQELSQVARELRDAHLAQGLCDLHQSAGKSLRILLGDGSNQLDEDLTRSVLEPPNNPEIDQTDDVVWEDEDIPGVRVGVEQAVHEYLLENGVGSPSAR